MQLSWELCAGVVAGIDGLTRPTHGAVEMERFPCRSWTFLTRSFLVARWFVLLALLVGDGEEKPIHCDPKYGKRVGASCGFD